jgi:hypothetical protein
LPPKARRENKQFIITRESAAMIVNDSTEPADVSRSSNEPASQTNESGQQREDGRESRSHPSWSTKMIHTLHKDFKIMAQPRVTRSLAAIATATMLAVYFAVPTLAQQKEETGESQMSAEGRFYDISRQLDLIDKNYSEATNNNDAVAMAALFAEDAIFVTEAGPI